MGGEVGVGSSGWVGSNKMHQWENCQDILEKERGEYF